MPCIPHISPCSGEDCPPLRLGRLYAQSQIGQARNCQNGITDSQGYLHQNRGQGIGQYVLEQNGAVRRAHGPGRLHKFTVLYRKHCCPGDSGVFCNTGHGQSQKQVKGAGSQGRHNGHGQQHVGHCQQHIHDAHDGVVGLAPVKRGYHAEGGSHDHGQCNGHHADGK